MNSLNNLNSEYRINESNKPLDPKSKDSGKLKYFTFPPEINFEIYDINELDRESDDKMQESISHSSNSKSEEINRKSVMIKNLNLEATIDEVEKLFSKFGLVNKITLICDKYSGRSKGKACIEYESQNSKDKSMEMDNTQFQKKVMRVEEKKREIPLHLGRREKCYNLKMIDYFTSTKNNFGPIKIKKSLKRRCDPY